MRPILRLSILRKAFSAPPRRASIGLGLLTFLLFSASGAAENRVLKVPGMDYGLPFSPAVEAGDFIYLSGAIGNELGTTLVRGTAERQLNRTLENLRHVLRVAGSEPNRVVSAQVYLSDARYFDILNRVYGSYFRGDRPPARLAVEADIAIPEAMTEIAVIAARPGVELEWIRPEGWRSSPSYAWGVRAGDTLFLSGLVSTRPSAGQIAQGDIGIQAAQALRNVGDVLKAADMGPENVAFCNVFLADPRDFQAMNTAYADFFRVDPPARATVRASLADPELKIEIACTAVRGERKVIRAEDETPSRSPLSPAIRVGDRLYLSGMVGRDKDGKFPPDAAAQTRLVLDKLKRTLSAADMGFEDVVSATVYLSDIRHYEAMNAVYKEIMPTPPPARTTVGTQLMSADAWVEISMIAVDSGE